MEISIDQWSLESYRSDPFGQNLKKIFNNNVYVPFHFVFRVISFALVAHPLSWFTLTWHSGMPSSLGLSLNDTGSFLEFVTWSACLLANRHASPIQVLVLQLPLLNRIYWGIMQPKWSTFRNIVLSPNFWANWTRHWRQVNDLLSCQTMFVAQQAAFFCLINRHLACLTRAMFDHIFIQTE